MYDIHIMTIYILSMHGLNSRYRYRPMVFSINTINIGNIGLEISQYYRVNLVWGTSKPRMGYLETWYNIANIYRDRPIFGTMILSLQFISSKHNLWCGFPKYMGFTCTMELVYLPKYPLHVQSWIDRDLQNICSFFLAFWYLNNKQQVWYPNKLKLAYLMLCRKAYI